MGTGITRADDRPLLGVGYLLAFSIMIPAMDALAKDLSSVLPVLQIVWGRCIFHLAMMLPFVLVRHGLRGLWPTQIGMQVLRGALMLACIYTFFQALKFMPMADALALAFVGPLVQTALSPLLLGEQVGPRRYAAVIVGFAGVLIVLRPGGDFAGWYTLLPMATGLCYALYAITTRRLAHSAPTVVTLTFTALFGAVIMSAAMPAVWQPPDALAWGKLVAIAALAAVGNYCVIRAYEFAPASLLAPLHYTEIVSATLLGLLLFGDFPDLQTWLGIAVIVSAGIYIAVREGRLARIAGRGAPPAAPNRDGIAP